MKKSTRLLALLLCVVMMASLLPTFALADAPLVVDDKGIGQNVIKLSADRYSVYVDGDTEMNYTDYGYGDETTYLIPHVENGTEINFTISRWADDINRWWRWAKDGDKLNQRESNSASGYDKHDGTPGVDGMWAQIWWQTSRTVVDSYIPRKTHTEYDNHYVELPKDGTREKCYISQKPLLSPRPWCFIWSGGDEQKSANVIVYVDQKLPAGTESILWSANGTEQARLVPFDDVVKGTDTRVTGIEHGFKELPYRVHYGDLGQNFIIMVEDVRVTYDLDGGKIGGDTRARQYVLWSTTDKKTSQRHRVITDIPEKDGFTFDGWYCEELEKMVVAGSDLDDGITKDMTITAQWKKNIDNPDYYIDFYGNGHTNKDMILDESGQPTEYYTQACKFESEPNQHQTLTTNRFIRKFTLTLDENYGDLPTSDIEAVSEMRGWGTSENSGVVYENNANIDNPLTTEEYAHVPLYAQWADGSIKMPTPERTVSDDDADNKIVSWRFDGWFDAATGGNLVAAGGAIYTPTGDMTLYAQWTPIKDTKFYVVHVTNGVAGSATSYKTEDYEDSGLNLPNMVTSGYLYGGTFTDAACTGIATETPKSLIPEAGQTYYIREVSDQHLQPSTLSVWANVNGEYDVTNIYLITAIDREWYDQVGFIVNDSSLKVSDNGRTLYKQIQIKQGSATIPFTYFKLNPLADKTENSYMYCCEVTGFKTGATYTVKPYWKTLDGITVEGSSRSFTYNGPGTGDINKRLTMGALEKTSNAKASPAMFNQPLMLMSTYSMAASAPAALPEPAIVNVVDGENKYTVNASNNSIDIQPAGQDGKLFAGWYVDEPCTMPAILDKVKDGDTVYAKYISDSYLQVKYNAVFTLLSKSVSLTSAVDRKDYAETGYVISTKNGDDKVVVSNYATKFALQNANQLFGVEKNAPLMNVDYKLNGLSKNDKVTITPYLVTADGTTVYGTARTLTYTGLTMKG